MGDTHKKEQDDKLSVLKRAVSASSEHFDAVMIFGTYMDSKGKSVRQQWGSGNWFARYGVIKEWVRQAETDDASPTEDFLS